MAIFNGTQVADLISGTNDDDVITGLAGDDIINGAGGNDQINAGAGIDNILGGDGDDIITISAAADIGAGTIIDGGDDNDTLVTELLAGDTLNQDIAADLVWGIAATTRNLETVQVTNASDYMLDLSADALFGVDLTLQSSDALVGAAAPLGLLSYDTSNGAVAAVINADAAAGLVIDGTAYMAGDTYTTADGGSAAVTFAGGAWSLDYTPEAADTYAVGNGGSAADDRITTVVATITDATTSETTDVTVNFALNLDANFDASAATAGVTTAGDSQDNTMTGSGYDDTIWAGGPGSGNDSVNGGAGDDTIGAGDGNDAVNGDAGDDTIYAGDGNDAVNGGAGDDTIWLGAGDDNAPGANGGAGDDIIGGGDGDDTVIGDAGNDTIYGGADDGDDTLNGNAGNDTIYGGDGADTLNGGTGDDLIFNGAGDDPTVNGGAGDDILWGGAGDDIIAGGTGDDTFAFVVGNGNDIVTDFGFDVTDPDGNDVLDLTAFGYANTQAVLDDMSDVGGVATLALAPGQTITFNTLFKNDFQSAVDDWVLV